MSATPTGSGNAPGPPARLPRAERGAGLPAARRHKTERWRPRCRLPNIRRKTEAVQADRTPEVRIRHPLLSFLPIPRNQCSDQIDLAWEMVMDARLADPDHISDVGITETVVAASDDQRTRTIQDVISGGRQVAHAVIYLLVGCLSSLPGRVRDTDELHVVSLRRRQGEPGEVGPVFNPGSLLQKRHHSDRRARPISGEGRVRGGSLPRGWSPRSSSCITSLMYASSGMARGIRKPAASR